MDINLNVILEQMGTDEAFCISYIHSLLKEGAVTLEEELLIHNKEYTLKAFMEQKYSTNKKAKNILSKYDIDYNNINEKMSYSLLRSTLTNMFYEEDITKIKTTLEHFLNKKIPPKKIVDYINSEKFKESQINDIYQCIMNSVNSVYIFNEIIHNYLGFDNIKESLLNEILNTHYFLNSVNAFKVCLANPILKDIQLTHESYYHALFHNSFDIIKKEKLVNEQEIENFVNYFFTTRVNKQFPYFCLHDKNIILSRKEWFKEKCGDEDIISVLARLANGFYSEQEKRADLRGKRFFINDAQNNIEILMDELKNKKSSGELKSYLNHRNRNLLVEYLANGRGIKKKIYDTLIKKLPELFIKDNEHGLLDSILTDHYFIHYLEYKNIIFFNSLPLSLLLSNNDERILKTVEKMPALEKIDYQYQDLYLSFADLLKNSVQELNKARRSEALDKGIKIISQKIK